MNMLSNLDEIANLIIRPSRYTYKMTDLGNKTFKIDDRVVTRHDFQIENPRQLKIKCSIYATFELKDIQQVLIYLHCNSGCRVQVIGLSYLKQAIEHNLAYLIFDFTGSGMSQGKYVSLGYYETTDLQCVYQYVKKLIKQNAKIILWGRSMGAVTGINFLLSHNYQVFMAVFDSPFRSLKQLFVQIGRQKTSFPDFILEMAYNYLKPVIQQKAGFDIQQVDLHLQNAAVTTPGIFIASKQDTLVPFSQIDQIFTSYKGPKQMHFIDQGHNQSRSPKLIGQIFKSITKQITQHQLKIEFKQQQNRQIKQKNLKNEQTQTKKYNTTNNNKFINSNQYERLEKKDLSRKKLELTIKSLSQRHLLGVNAGKIFRDADERRNIQQEKLKRTDNKNWEQGLNKISCSIQKVKQNCNKESVINNSSSYKKSTFEPAPSYKTGGYTNLSSFQHNSTNHLPRINIKPYSSPEPLTPTPTLQKKPISCLLPHKKSFKMISIDEEDGQSNDDFAEDQKKVLAHNRSEAKIIRGKKKPFQIKNFFGGQNSTAKGIQYSQFREQKYLMNRVRLGNESKPLQEKFDNHINSSNSSSLKMNQTFKNYSQVFTKPYGGCTKGSSPRQPPAASQCSNSNSNLHMIFRTKKSKMIIREPSSGDKPQQKQQPHSQIKNESLHVNKINFHEDFIKEKQFLKRCQSLQKVFKLKQNTSKLMIVNNQPNAQISYKNHNSHADFNNHLNHPNQQQHQTYREIKCTERVLEKIIEKQEKKLMVLNVQNVTNNNSREGNNNRESGNDNNHTEGKCLDKQKSLLNNQNKMKQRKTFQHIVNKKPPFVQLKGIKNYRNSLQSKYKTEIRK